MNIVKYFDLKDIVLVPSKLNNDEPRNKADFMVSDSFDKTTAPTLPIFVSPSESLVSKENSRLLMNSGLRPILPQLEPLNDRLQLCMWMFCSFTVQEIQENFLNKRANGTLFHIYIRTHNGSFQNGHSKSILSLIMNLKRFYGPQVIIMYGPVGNSESYAEFSRAGVDYIRVGIDQGSLDYSGEFGFGIPLGSLLNDIKSLKKIGGLALPKQVKIIAEGGIESPLDIIKALALGADYVMVGKSLASTVEMWGTVYAKTKELGGIKTDEIMRENLMDVFIAGEDNLERKYVQYRKWTWVPVNKLLRTWIDEFKNCAYYAFTMTGTVNFTEFKQVITYGLIDS